MKTVFLILMIGLSGCASAWVQSDNMQSDGSYKIYARGNSFANNDDSMGVARSWADGLCPNGYSTQSMMNGSAPLWKPISQLVVRCN